MCTQNRHLIKRHTIDPTYQQVLNEHECERRMGDKYKVSLKNLQALGDKSEFDKDEENNNNKVDIVLDHKSGGVSKE